jgi:hypothetical protein
MGVTNIRSAEHLLDRAGHKNDQVALIPEPLMTAVYLDGNPSSADELELYSDQLSSPPSERSRYFRLNQPTKIGLKTPVAAPGAMKVPVARITCGLKVGQGQTSTSDHLAFVAVVQGLSGADTVKIHRRDSPESIARAIFHELMNGYSIVFSGAFLSSEAKRIGNLPASDNISGQRVNSYAELLELEKSNDDVPSADRPASSKTRKIGIVC